MNSSTIDNWPPSPTISNESPKTLTPLGEKISQDLNAKLWADLASRRVKTADRKYSVILQKSDRDIEDFCVSYVDGIDIADEDYMNKVSAYAAYNGIEKRSVFYVLVIEMRDALLKIKNN